MIMIKEAKHLVKLSVIPIIVMGSTSSSYGLSNLGGIPDGYRTGQWPIYPKMLPEQPKTIMLLEKKPVISMVPGTWEVKINFTTVVPTINAKVYVGMYEPDALLLEPRFIPYEWIEKLEQPSHQHSITVDLGVLQFIPSSDFANLIANQGGVVIYRLKLTAPQSVLTMHPLGKFIDPTRYYEQRFEICNKQLIPTIIEGPFVDQITPTSAIISWHTNQPVSGTVKIHTHNDGVNDSKEISSKPGKHTHFEIPLTELEPGTTYYYQANIYQIQGSELCPASNSSEESKWYYFKTPANNTTEFSFVVLGDSRASETDVGQGFGGVNPIVLQKFTVYAFNKEADFIIHTGDLFTGYTSSPFDFKLQLDSYKNVVEAVGPYIPIYEMMGKHEVVVKMYGESLWPGVLYNMLMFDREAEKSGEAMFARAFVNPRNGPNPDNAVAGAPPGKSLPPYQENVYYFDYGNSRFVAMNNTYWYSALPEYYGGNLQGYVLDDQKKWLLDIFNKTKADDSITHLFLLGHVPPFPVGTHEGMWYSGGDPKAKINGGWNRKYISERRDEIWRAFIATGKAAVGIFGHEHNYSRTLIKDLVKDKNGKFVQPLWQIVSGGAGAPAATRVNNNAPWSNDVKKFTTQLNYTVFKVNGSEVKLEVYNINHRLIDSVDLTKKVIQDTR